MVLIISQPNQMIFVSAAAATRIPKKPSQPTGPPFSTFSCVLLHISSLGSLSQLADQRLDGGCSSTKCGQVTALLLCDRGVAPLQTQEMGVQVLLLLLQSLFGSLMFFPDVINLRVLSSSC